MRYARSKAKTIAAKHDSRIEKFRRIHERFPRLAKAFCIKSPVFWVLAFYIIKGTTVTIAAIAALYFGFSL